MTSPTIIQIFKNSAVVLFGQGISLLLRMATILIMARYVGKEQFGVFSYGLIFISFFALLSDFGMKPIVIRELSREKWPASQILGNIISFKLIFSFFAILLTVISARILNLSNIQFSTILILSITILVSFRFSTVRVIFEAPFQAKLQMVYPIMFQLLDGLLIFGLTFLLISQDSSFLSLLIVFACGSFPGFLLNVIFLVRRISFKLQIQKNIIAYFFKESLSIWIYSILAVLFAGIDVLYINTLFGDEAVGLYASALRLTAPLLFIPTALLASVFPLLSKIYMIDEKFEKVFNLGFKILFLIGLGLALIVTFFGGKIILMLYSDQYSGAIEAFKILMWAEIFYFLNIYFSEVLISRNLQRKNIFAALIMVVSNLILIYFLIPQYNIAGASYAKLFSLCIGTIFFLKVIAKQVNITLFHFIPQFVLFVILFLFLGYLVRDLNFFISIVFYTIGFVLFLFFSRVFNKEERDVLVSIVKTIIVKLQSV